MTKQQLLQELEALIYKMDIDLRYERGNIKGGLCRVHDKQAFIINKQFSIEEKIDIIIQSLKELPTEDIYIPPEIRRLLEKEEKFVKEVN